ncbi:hypothetical protein WICANDRAFT_76903 [Wickerhamomyces anomalus NRRL Y-366-8]|uniref:BHLH domain-containing protein n=1 Tax=Wickerhamomyces anomalus (strain ATCC 58044 / CBS 1984 / NCYC 433 / NRRL Y-366-8) TaxID=683960 RepID=A0A1E3PBF4_WICAA|nr:uncharacterized protein WICANDRAFT_76903 [Wickerhamomyces anomalus NRRL Y-366-8]ODQ62735.1 hypothetical protein WICANDRAFT_76903 [Wickerhamomyces anomalus NRRL Y-366-8]
MNQSDIKPPTSAPSTPPLFSISSPDFKNFKSWVKTSPFTNDFDLSKDKLQLSDMDFEVAYAMFTAKTPPATASGSQTPITNYQSELSNQLHELHNQREFGYKITSPGLSHLLQAASPNFPPTELEGLPLFSNYDELLSVNESHAIEQFLDSIMDEQNVSKSSKQEQSESLRPDPMISEEQQYFKQEDEVSSEGTSKAFIESPETATDISITFNNTNINLPKDPNIFPKELNISTDSPIPTRSSSNTSFSGSETSRPTKKRKLLTDDEKKFNHTSSEQRRRGIIKDAFDDLVKLLPLSNKKQPKSLVLETAAHEIERLLKINNELKQLLDKH